MRILDRYLYRELVLTFLAVLLVLLLITFGAQASELLTLAVKGEIAPSLVSHLLLLKVPPALEVILPLVVLLTVLLTFGRLYQDQEMVVLQSCGVPPRYFLKRALVLVSPLMVFGLLNSLWITPWSFSESRQLMQDQQTKAPLAAFQPGRFNVLGGGKGVFYVEREAEDGLLHTVWLQYETPQRWIQINARTGRFIQREGRIWLQLHDGWSVEAPPHRGQAQAQTVTMQRFEKFEGLIPYLSAEVRRPSRLERYPAELWTSGNSGDLALLHQRMLMPFTLLAMAWMGVVLSRTRPREGRFGRLAVGLLSYVVYVQLITLFQDRVAKGESLWVVAMWSVPLVVIGYIGWRGWRPVADCRAEGGSGLTAAGGQG